MEESSGFSASATSQLTGRCSSAPGDHHHPQSKSRPQHQKGSNSTQLDTHIKNGAGRTSWGVLQLYMLLHLLVLQMCSRRATIVALQRLYCNIQWHAQLCLSMKACTYTFAKANNYSHIFWELQLHCWFDCCVSC